MTIKEIRSLTGLSQADFGKYYHIPLPTIKKWETDPNSQNHRECPVYVKQLLERVVRIDFEKQS
ncbi:MAG: DNA-binding protein [Lachnospiraceae bacterium]|nr:DNA-binding protein [Lachnospiraceae bacterium]